MLDATHARLDEIAARAERGTLAGVGDIGVAVGKVINRYKVGKYFQVTITPASLTSQRGAGPRSAPRPPSTGSTYCAPRCPPPARRTRSGVRLQDLAHVERDFRIVKADDLDLRFIYHRPEDRVKADVLICMLACYLVWHLRRAWAPLTFADEHPPRAASPSPQHKAHPKPRPRPPTSATSTATATAASGGLLEHLATLTRNQVRFAGTNTGCPCSPGPPHTSGTPST